MMLHIGFTGTQQGMTPKQREAVGKILFHSGAQCVRHGDCIGADAEFHKLARQQGFIIRIHPPTNSSKRAFCANPGKQPYVEVYAPMEYLERNRAIVEASDRMIAAPKGGKPELRSGTWATIRYALKRHKAVDIVWPTGDVMEVPAWASREYDYLTAI